MGRQMGAQDELRLVAFEVTRRCRFSCRHCRAASPEATQAGGAGDAQEMELTTEQCKKILKAVADFTGGPTSGGQGCVIILTGGEPMERGDIYELIGYGRRIGLRMVSATCGYTISDQTARKLKEAGLTAISISLDGATVGTHDEFRRTPGAFDAAIGAAKAARKAGIRFQINTTITKDNIAEVPAIAKLAEELGAYCFNPFILVPTGRGREIADQIVEPAKYERLLEDLVELKMRSVVEMRVTCGPQFARVYEQTVSARQITPITNHQSSIINFPVGCMGGRGFGFISYRGDVQTCGFLDVSAGNLVENGYDFAKIWIGSPFLNEIRDCSAYKGACVVCGYVTSCGGCRARAYAMTGDYMESDPICRLVALRMVQGGR